MLILIPFLLFSSNNPIINSTTVIDLSVGLYFQYKSNHNSDRSLNVTAVNDDNYTLLYTSNPPDTQHNVYYDVFKEPSGHIYLSVTDYNAPCIWYYWVSLIGVSVGDQLYFENQHIADIAASENITVPIGTFETFKAIYIPLNQEIYYEKSTGIAVKIVEYDTLLNESVYNLTNSNLFSSNISTSLPLLETSSELVSGLNSEVNSSQSISLTLIGEILLSLIFLYKWQKRRNL